MKRKTLAMVFMASMLLVGCGGAATTEGNSQTVDNESVESEQKETTESKTQNSETENSESENSESEKPVVENTLGESYVVDESKFTCWDLDFGYFENFSYAEHVGEDGTYGVLYDDAYILTFKKDKLEIITRESQESFEVELPDYLKTDSVMGINAFYDRLYYQDVTGDGVNELIIEDRSERGTNFLMHPLDIIDIANQRVVPLNYTVEDLKELMPDIEVTDESFTEDGERESISVKYEILGKESTYTLDAEKFNLKQIASLKMEVISSPDEYDERILQEDGTILVETIFGFPQEDGLHIDGGGNLSAKLVYKEDIKGYALDKDSLVISWE